MSGKFFKRPGSNMSSTADQQQLPFSESEATLSEAQGQEGNGGLNASQSSNRRARASSITSGLSTSYNLPSRSYIHHAGHSTQEPPQYSSAGVRQQTAELSSSFLSDSDTARFLDKPLSPRNSGEQQRDRSNPSPRPRHESIAEQSEPASPRDPTDEGAAQSGLTQMLHSTPVARPHRASAAPAGRKVGQDQVSVPTVVVHGEEQPETETTPLLSNRGRSSHPKQTYGGDDEDVEAQSEDLPGSWDLLDHKYPSWEGIKHKIGRASNPTNWDGRKIMRKAIVEPVFTIPAVFLGVLLNLLDGLSYGIILFPLGEEIFSKMGPDGLSMFFVSCIISQLVYSSGSLFRGGVGSEMIEVVPFMHKMTYLILGKMGEASPDAVRATVITSYAMSSIITGLVFFILGAARLGTLVNFFPHSILTGCIGGVGIFLFLTGIEVSSRLEGNFEFSGPVFRQLFTGHTPALWIPPLALAILLLSVKHVYDRPWLVPAFYIGITVIFYIITVAVPSVSMDGLRNTGWVFEAPEAGVPFYNFYSHYKFRLVDWDAIWMTVPSQLALTFFGILHVPINVPNLAIVVQEDNLNINRELIMHGVSNTLSGCVGSIQNYLVFVNSVLFMNTGGNSRLAGYMLAAATFALWVVGPVIIGFVPVMVVGTLIYQLGIELAMDAIWATYGKLHRLEYFTIVAIALVMGIYDFVVGICVGIALACLVYVVQTSRKTVIRAEFSGDVAESTVRRHMRQRNYLHKVGKQIRVFKLGGYLFFGSIVDVEKKVRAVIDEQAFNTSPIRYLALDFTHVTGIDFSAAEAFNRMNRVLHKRNVQLALAGVSLHDEIGKGLQMVGLFVADSDAPDIPVPKLFEDLNGALEFCENEMLVILTEKQRNVSRKGDDSPPMQIPEPSQGLKSDSPFDELIGSPRRALLDQAASTIVTENAKADDSHKWQNLKQPLPLLLQAFQDLTSKNEDFWFRALPYFSKREFLRGQVLYSRGDRPDGFYLLQSGIFRAEYFLEQGNYHESIVAGTTCGELPFFSETQRTSTVVAEQDCIAWLLAPEKWEEMQERDGEVAKELLKVGMKLSAERMNAVTSYVLITAS
ncbi:hypothetical protein K431DRAFT_244621 [Polychaeton citri CBS 116435]|uniref:Sulfate transporter family protein n=1 Tax=Polychaeton citri CBS 116435 TaxID=1314669 RepID=A0A9P4US13_9PEZI|nr:hypothetical protein K431DRAFT_244621 [Polychaeton citri CBS 116435]